MSDPNGNREIETVVDVREFYSSDGELWLELFPYVFAPVDRDGIANWAELQLLNPAAAGLVFAAHGPDTGYLAPQDEFYNGLNLLVESVDWLRDEEFDFDDGSSLARLLGTITIGRSHDPIGALWIDRLKWIDENIDVFTEKSVDSLRRVDFDRNRKIMHEVNWLSVFFNPSNERKYPRPFTPTELVGYGIDEWSIYFALQFPRGDSDWKTFYENGCGNSILRDICEAHIFFERTLDPDPQHLMNDHEGCFEGENRRELRDRWVAKLNPEANLRIEEFVVKTELDDLNFKQFWMYSEQTLMPTNASSVKSEVEEFAEFVKGAGDFPSEGLADWTSVTGFLVPFVLNHSEMFSDSIVSRVAALHITEDGPDWIHPKHQWVFDEIRFWAFPPTFNPTGTQASNAFHNFLTHRGIFEANAVFALAEFLNKVAPDAFDAWANSPSQVFENGFRNVEDFRLQSEAIISTYWDAAKFEDSE